jgi:glycosyltransferase involved in cell wall biosynthesis
MTSSHPEPGPASVDGTSRRLCCYLTTEVLGGMETAVATLLANLDDWDVTVMGVSQPVIEYVVDGNTQIRTVCVPGVRHKSNVGAIAAHIRAVHRVRPDLMLISLSQLYDAQYGILAARVNRVPTVAVVHSVFPPTSSSVDPLFRLVSGRVRAFGGVSRSVCAQTEEALGRRPGSVTVLYNGVPDPSVDRRAPGAEEGSGSPLAPRFTIGVVGRLVPEKGFDVMLRALIELPGADLVLVGEGPARSSLERLSRDLGLDGRVTFTGRVGPPWTSRWRFDVLAVPSRIEGFGLVAVEALLAGIPVVGSRVGGLCEVLTDGRTGLLVPVDDPTALASALRTLQDDPSLRRELAEQGSFDARQRFSVDAMMGSYRAFLEG